MPNDDDCAWEYLRLTELAVAGCSHRAHILDRLIAASARAHGLTVITCSFADFKPASELVAVAQH